jgi:hypothetical protein
MTAQKPALLVDRPTFSLVQAGYRLAESLAADPPLWRDQNVMPIPPTAKAIRIKKRMVCLNQAIAGTATARATPRKAISAEICMPATNVPSASNSSNANPVAGAVKKVLTLDHSTMFIAIKNAPQ